MKKVIACFLITLFFISCSHRINRIGYSAKKSERWNCDLPIKKSIPSDTSYQKIGEIQFKECKNTKIKTKEDVISALKKDGCAIDAEFAIISEENNILAEKVCYQCTAEYYVKRTEVAKSPDFVDSNDPKRLNHKERVLLRIGTGLVIIAGFLIWKVYLGF